MKNILRSASLAGSIALLCACGAKGPLFMPEEAPPIELPEPAEADEAPLDVDGTAPVDAQDDPVDAEGEPEPEPEPAPEPEEDPAPPDDAG